MVPINVAILTFFLLFYCKTFDFSNVVTYYLFYGLLEKVLQFSLAFTYVYSELLFLWAGQDGSSAKGMVMMELAVEALH